MFNAKFITGCISSVSIEGLILNKSYLVIGFQKKINEFLDLQKIDLNIAEFEKTFETVPSKLNELRNKIDLRTSNKIRNSKLFIAYYLGKIRLIDNLKF